MVMQCLERRLLTWGVDLQAFLMIKALDQFGNAVTAPKTADGNRAFRAEITGAKVPHLTPQAPWHPSMRLSAARSIAARSMRLMWSSTHLTC